MEKFFNSSHPKWVSEISLLLNTYGSSSDQEVIQVSNFFMKVVTKHSYLSVISCSGLGVNIGKLDYIPS